MEGIHRDIQRILEQQRIERLASEGGPIIPAMPRNEVQPTTHETEAMPLSEPSRLERIARSMGRITGGEVREE